VSRSGIEPDGLAKPVAVAFNANQLPRVMEYVGIEPDCIRDKIISTTIATNNDARTTGVL